MEYTGFGVWPVAILEFNLHAFQSMNDNFNKTMLCFFLFWKVRIDNLNSLDLLITQVELSYSLRHYYADCYHISYIFLTNFYLHRKRQNDQSELSSNNRRRCNWFIAFIYVSKPQSWTIISNYLNLAVIKTKYAYYNP